MLSCESKIPKLHQRFQPFHKNYNIGSKLMVIKAQVTICITLFKKNKNKNKNFTSAHHLKSSYAKDIKSSQPIPISLFGCQENTQTTTTTIRSK